MGMMLRAAGAPCCRTKRGLASGVSVVCAIGFVLAFAPAASAADLDENPYYRYSPRSSAYPPPPAPEPYGYRDREERYAYRYDPYRRPYAERPPAPIPPHGPYAVDPRDVPPDEMLADETPPPYGWRGRPRW